MSVLDVVPEPAVFELVEPEVELGSVLVELGAAVLLEVEVDGVAVPLLLRPVDEVPDVVLLGAVLLVEPCDVAAAPVAPVPDVPAMEPELLARVSDELLASPVELWPELVPAPVPAPVCAYATPITAAMAARVKLFGNLLIWRSPVAK